MVSCRKGFINELGIKPLSNITRLAQIKLYSVVVRESACARARVPADACAQQKEQNIPDPQTSADHCMYTSSLSTWSVYAGIDMSSTEMTDTAKITPEVLQELLQYYNLSRQEFIHTYNIQPLVYIPELPAGAKARSSWCTWSFSRWRWWGTVWWFISWCVTRAMRTATNILHLLSGRQRPAHHLLLHPVHTAAEHLFWVAGRSGSL